jgi:hypothetical protein
MYVESFCEPAGSLIEPQGPLEVSPCAALVPRPVPGAYRRGLGQGAAAGRGVENADAEGQLHVRHRHVHCRCELPQRPHPAGGQRARGGGSKGAQVGLGLQDQWAGAGQVPRLPKGRENELASSALESARTSILGRLYRPARPPARTSVFKLGRLYRPARPPARTSVFLARTTS